METNSRPVVCIGKREPKEVISLGQRVLPNPLRPAVNQRFVAALALSQCQRYRRGKEKSDTEQKRTRKELLLNRSGLSIHCGFPRVDLHSQTPREASSSSTNTLRAKQNFTRKSSFHLPCRVRQLTMVPQLEQFQNFAVFIVPIFIELSRTERDSKARKGAVASAEWETRESPRQAIPQVFASTRLADAA
jgi:hypothetical protein